MLTKVKNVISPHFNKTIVLSVSGGVDSLVLFYLLKELQANLVIVHFNHLKRESSKEEAKYVESLASSFSFPYEYFELNIDSDFHNTAHSLRKKYLKEVASSYGTDVIVTAHHANDLLETILMKLSRGSNLLGYSGFLESYNKDSFYYLKPLLTVKKEDIIAYAKENNIIYFEDQSNQSDAYTRNRYRHHIIPLLLEETPGLFEKAFQYNKTLSDAFFHVRNETISFLNNEKHFLISEFFKLDDIVKQDIIAYLLENENVDFTYAKTIQIIDFLSSSSPNAYVDVGSDFIFQKVYNKVFLKKKTFPVFINQELDLNAFNVLKDNTIIEFTTDLEEFEEYGTSLCYNNIALPLFARGRKEGDTLYFSYGHKKLKDYYIDKKIPKEVRDSDVLIVDSHDQILAILGKYYNENPKNKEKILVKFKRG